MYRLSVLVALVACSSTAAAPTVFFETGARDTFFDMPFPSDLRLTTDGVPDMTDYPNPRSVPLLNSLLAAVGDRRGFPVMPVGYFRFTAPVPDHTITDVIDPSLAELIDIDPASSEMGTSFPIVAATLIADQYIPDNLVALAPRPGLVLRPATTYAFVIHDEFAPGFAAPSGFTQLDNSALGAVVDLGDVLVATTFTTADVVARTRARSEAVRAAYHPTIDNLTLSNGSTYDGFCAITATITMPQFQTGTEPFDTGGTFQLDANDVPQMQGTMTIPLSITLPKTAMPANGWPLYQFFHGSGGVSTGLIDLGHSPTSADVPDPGKGPGYVVALHGIAAASSALPLNPERLKDASDYAYLNINNLEAFPFTFQQGVFEQRMFTDALLALEIPQSLVAACGIPAPAGGSHHFDATKLVAGGQSMGGMYTNMIGAVEGRFGALVPTGAGGFWNLMILESTIVPGARGLLASALGIDDAQLSFVHPAMETLALAWEPAEPLVSMARLAHRPLDGLTARHVYEPVGMNDTYFPIDVYDAAALAYQNQEAGDAIWPSMQTALAVDDLSGLAGYPVKANRDGLTRVVVQFMGDGIIDPHYIYRQLDSVKHQYGCFLETYLSDGVPTVSPPAGLTDPCMH